MSFAPWQREVFDSAVQAHAQGRLGHALLLVGPAHLGKRMVAEALAKRLLCSSPGPDSQACGQCRSCRLFEKRSQRDPVETRPDASLSPPDGHPGHPDAAFLGFVLNEKANPKKMRTELVVEQIRELGRWFALTSSQGVAQVALIEPADQLNESAANALLKTLEEPAQNRFLLLVTSKPGRLPATIRSRCQRLEFRLPAIEEAQAWLRRQGFADADIDAALAAARGNPGLAAEWLRSGGLKLRRDVLTQLNAVGAGRAGAIETAQGWLADGLGELRLRFAADLALEAAAQRLGAGPDAAGDLTPPADFSRLSGWFDSVNRTREQLRMPVRSDLVLAGLLREWRTMFQARR